MNNDLQEFTGLIEQWAEDRNLHTADPIKQYDKLIEEFGELMKGINKQDMPMIKDSIGDMYVVMTIMSMQTDNSMVKLLEDGGIETIRPKHSTFGYMFVLSDLGDLLNDRISFIMPQIYDLKNQLVRTCGEYNISFMDCVGLAYNEIKGRTGIMKNGTFIKREDL